VPAEEHAKGLPPILVFAVEVAKWSDGTAGTMQSDEYAKDRATAKDKKWFRHPGIDVRGPERRDNPFGTHMRRFYVYDRLPTLQTLNAQLLAIFGELDTPEGVDALRVSKRMGVRSGKS
jgi:hypothetical protein